MPLTDYTRNLRRVTIKRLDPAPEREPQRLRLYCTQVADGGRWGLQIRGPECTRSYTAGKRDYFAHAELSREDMTSLRDAIIVFLDRV
jgi:hypothetical protein